MQPGKTKQPSQLKVWFNPITQSNYPIRYVIRFSLLRIPAGSLYVSSLLRIRTCSNSWRQSGTRACRGFGAKTCCCRRLKWCASESCSPCTLSPTSWPHTPPLGEPCVNHSSSFSAIRRAISCSYVSLHRYLLPFIYRALHQITWVLNVRIIMCIGFMIDYTGSLFYSRRFICAYIICCHILHVLYLTDAAKLSMDDFLHVTNYKINYR